MSELYSFAVPPQKHECSFQKYPTRLLEPYIVFAPIVIPNITNEALLWE